MRVGFRSKVAPLVAEVRAIEAVHYDLNVVGSLADVAAPPYDVIDAEKRAALLKRD